MTTTVQRPTGRDLIDPVLFDRFVRRITVDHPDIQAALAERILDQALAFLGACATTTRPIGPSPLVDIGWHTFILYTAEYAQFCDRVAGRFIHHAPDDGEGPGTSLSAALDAMRGQGFHVDGELWGLGQGECTTNCCQSSDCSAKAVRSDCTQCHAGCHDSPKTS